MDIGLDKWEDNGDIWDMAKLLKCDWPLAQSLWMQGLPRAEIAQRVGCPIGTLQKRARRGGWTAGQLKVAEELSAGMQRAIVRNLASVAAGMREACAVDADGVLEALRLRDPKGMTLEELDVRERIARSAQARGFSACGLTDQPVSTAVNIHLMGSLNAQFDAMQHAIVVDAQPVSATQPVDSVRLEASEPDAI